MTRIAEDLVASGRVELVACGNQHSLADQLARQQALSRSSAMADHLPRGWKMQGHESRPALRDGLPCGR